MSVSEVLSRIGAIEGQFSALSPAPVASSGAAFTAAVQSVAAQQNLSTQPQQSSGTDLQRKVVDAAKELLGLPYVWGGTNPNVGVDCSGLVQYAYSKVGIDLPRVSFQQAQQGTAVPSLDQAQPGDLLAWDNSSRNVGADHIAIYIGDGKMIEAPRTGLDIRIVDVPSTPDYIRRILPAQSAATAMTANSATPAVPYAGVFQSAAASAGVDPSLLMAIAKQESAFNPAAVSPAGAQGIMQLMPGTAAGLGVNNPLDPNQAIPGAARLVAQLQNQFNRPELVLAAYNAGPGAVQRYGGVPPYAETQHYVKAVMSNYYELTGKRSWM